MALARAARSRYRPGDFAPISGLYEVHHRDHREPHVVTIIRGETQPPCRECKGEVRFEVVQPASHVTHDWDFTGPDLSGTPPRRRRDDVA